MDEYYTEKEQYYVQTQDFEGPFDLLLDLVQKRKFFINDVSLAAVTDDYIAYVRSSTNRSLPDVTTFMVIAATLILIKSKSLLPHIKLTDDEQEQIDDLESRLAAYQVIQTISEHIQRQYNTSILFVPTQQPGTQDSVFAPGSLSIEVLHESVYNAIAALPQDTDDGPPEVAVSEILSLDEVLESMSERIEQAMQMNFKDFVGTRGQTQREQKVHTIVSFLAMLELVRTGMLDAVQQHGGEDITLYNTTHEYAE